MTNAPERIWIEDEFGDGDDDQWTYGTWDVRNYRGYDVEYVRADLAFPAVQPEVKPLVWFEAELPSKGGGKFASEGYTIRRIEGLWLLDFAGTSKSAWRFSTLEVAKAAAQADYEARILAALKAQNREMALDVLASSGQAADAYAAQLAAEAERDRLREALTDAESYLGKGLDKMAYNILRAALKGDTP